MRDAAEPVNADLLIDVERARPHQPRQLAGRLAPLQIHLEEPILRVQESERPRRILARVRGDRRHSEHVAIDADIRGQTGDRRGAVNERQAGAHL